MRKIRLHLLSIVVSEKLMANIANRVKLEWRFFMLKIFSRVIAVNVLEGGGGRHNVRAFYIYFDAVRKKKCYKYLLA